LVKLGLVGLAAMVTAGLLSLMVTWWAGPIDHAASLADGSVQVAAGGAAGLHGSFFVLARLEPVIFAARGVAPLGYGPFAFALGVTAGVLLRRTLPALAVTLAVFVVIQVLVPNLVRPHLIQPVHVTTPLNVRNLSISLVNNGGSVGVQFASHSSGPARGYCRTHHHAIGRGLYSGTSGLHERARVWHRRARRLQEGAGRHAPAPLRQLPARQPVLAAAVD
jgi:hypothetical protein